MANPPIKLKQPRPLQPGQTAILTPAKPAKDQREKISKYVQNYTDKKNKLTRLKSKLNVAFDSDKPEIQQQIADLQAELDQQTQSYSQIISYIVPIIKSRCSNYLPIIQKHGFLYRGTRPEENKGRLAFRGHSRENRRPTSSDYEANILFNQAMDDLGLLARRDNSVFATGNISLTDFFGSAYIFFPCNGGHYTWSESVEDLIIHADDLFRDTGDTSILNELEGRKDWLAELSGKLLSSETQDAANEDLKDFYRSVESFLNDMDYIFDRYSMRRLQDYVEQGRALAADEKYLNELEDLHSEIMSLIKSIQDGEFEIDLERFRKFYRFHGDEDLGRAINTGNEVIFTGEYICVTAGLEDELRRALGMKKDTISEALKPGQMKPLAQFKNLNPGANGLEKLQKDLKNIEYNIQHYKAMIANYQKTMVRYEKKLGIVKKKLADPKIKKQKPDNSLDKLAKFLLSKSGNYIKEMRKANCFLYRGMESSKGNIIHGRSWLERETTDSDQDEQEAFDKILAKMGIKAQRGNSIFTTGSMDFASGYGELHLIFPFNSSPFSWSSEVDDLILHSGDITGRYVSRDPVKSKILNKVWETNFKQLQKIKDKLEYKDDLNVKEEKLFDALMVYGDDLHEDLLDIFDDNDFEDLEYVLDELRNNIRPFLKFPITKSIATKMLDTLKKFENLPMEINKNSISDFQDRYDISNKNFAEALKNGGEILISGEYIAVNANKYGAKLAKILKIDDSEIRDWDDDDDDW